jgi:dynein heavy chain
VFSDWIANGQPKVFWLPGFFFPQAFFSACLQNHARKYQLPINQLKFSFDVSDSTNEGYVIHGLYLEGARWDPTAKSLSECLPRESISLMPKLVLKPVLKDTALSEDSYQCPLYKTLLRAGTLSTTGHSTNYILAIDVPSRKPQAYWIKRGVALFCSLK